MRLADEYRRYAAESLELAGKQPDSADKSHLLLMAEAWLELADRIARRVTKRRHSVDHPLVERVLGPNRPNAE
jgi:hypothetical protein